MEKRTKSNNPIFFMEKGKDYKINPVYMIDKEINTADRFVITRLTDNGKWVRGGMLFFEINKVQIYTDANNAIFVDLRENTVFIKEYEKVLEQINPVDPEQRQYLLLLYCIGTDDSEEERLTTWESMIGRTQAYNWIKENIEIYNFDPNLSIVITENVPYKDALTISQFVNYLKNGDMIEEDDFNIDEYSL